MTGLDPKHLKVTFEHGMYPDGKKLFTAMHLTMIHPIMWPKLSGGDTAMLNGSSTHVGVYCNLDIVIACK